MKEEPCAIDGKPCKWVAETYYDDDGNETVDTICERCSRLKNWTKSER
jgi:hypothetical protein